MKRPILKTTFLLLLIQGFWGHAQIQNNEEGVIFTKTTVTSFDHRSKELVGSSYIDENFLPAKLMDNAKVYSMRYNVYQDEMEVEKDGEKRYLSKFFDFPITFLGVDKVYQLFNYKERNNPKDGYFVVLYRGDKVSLLLKEIIKLYDEVKPKTGYDKYQPPTLKRERDKFYIGYKNNTAIELPKKKKDILLLFSKKAKDVESFAKSNKLSFKDKDDLVRIFRYYDSISE